MKHFLLSRLLQWVGRRMDGHKTTAGAVGLILTGVLGLAGNIFPDQPGLPQMELETALATISAGLVALGLGGKAEKIRDAAAGRGDCEEDR